MDKAWFVGERKDGSTKPRASSVIANAKTPSENASKRALFIQDARSRAYAIVPSAQRRSLQRIRPVACIVTKSVAIAPIVIARPLQPSLNSVKENKMR